MIIRIIKKAIAGVLAWFCITLLMTGDQSGILLASYYVCLTELAVLLYLIFNFIFDLKITKKGNK